MNILQDKFRKVIPYVPGEQPGYNDMIKLNTNENPYPPSPEVSKILKSFDAKNLRLYPDPTSGELLKALSDYYKIPVECIYTGVGSDDVLAIAFLTFFNSDSPVLFPDITYSFYDVWAELFRIPYKTPHLDNNLCPVLSDYTSGIAGGIVLANPNAPTGISVDEDFLRKVIEANSNSVVIIDEAYADFSGYSAINLVNEYDNVLIVQTYSKSRSMAGMRIGYAFGSPLLIKAMNDVRYSFNSYPLTRLSVSLGVAALSDREYFEKCVNKIIKTRESSKIKLHKLDFSFTDSKTNFIFATHKYIPAADIYESLRKKHIFVRYFNKPRIDNYLRITVGTDNEMEKLFSALEKIVSSLT